MSKHIRWVDSEEKKLEKKILAEYSEDNVRKHLEFLTKMIRRAGTEEELKAAQYIKKMLDGYDVDAKIHEFEAYISLPGEASLEILSPVKKTIACLPRIFIASTPKEGIEGELVFFGKGLESDYRGLDLSNKIVLLEPGGTEGRMEAIRVALEKGVPAQIHITSGRYGAINFGQFRTTWGTPTWETFSKTAQTAAISICDEDGNYLKGLIKKGPVVAKMNAEASRGYRKVRLPVGMIKGANEPDRYVILGGHYCSWFIGATDNAVANSMMLEMARIFSKYREKIDRGIRFAWWTGHEQGTYAGSTWYLDHFWDDVRDNAIAYLVMDGIGRAGSSGFESRNTEEIRLFQEGVIREILGLEVKSKRVPKFGDQSFWGMGLPSMTGGTTFSSEQALAMGGNAVWYGHTSQDTLDKVDLKLAQIPFKVHSISLLRLCNNPVLPFEFVTMANLFEEGLRDQSTNNQPLLDLTSLMSGIRDFREKAHTLNNKISKHLLALKKNGPNKRLEKKFAEINRCLMDLSRILIPALSSKAGKYGQDPMGTKFKPIPKIQPSEKLSLVGKESEEFKALQTSLIRNRNEMSDSLYFANRILSQTIDKL